jgi:hypothetical protein
MIPLNPDSVNWLANRMSCFWTLKYWPIVGPFIMLDNDIYGNIGVSLLYECPGPTWHSLSFEAYEAY